MDKRKYNRGHAGKAGRKKGVGLSFDIQKECQNMIEQLMKNDKFKAKAEKQLLEIELREIENRSKECFYVLESEGVIKFGCTTDFSKRIKNYYTHNPNIKVIGVFIGLNKDGLSSSEFEAEIIERYIEHRVGGSEWFCIPRKELIVMLDYLNNCYYGK